MSLRFSCRNCNSEIVVQYLKVGEYAHCKNCNETTRVPENAEETTATPTYELSRQASKIPWASTHDYNKNLEELPSINTGGRGPISIPEVLFSFSGRVSRSEYWLKGFLVMLPFGILNNILAYGVNSDGARALAILFGLFSLWPGLALIVKRWHDRDRSAWWLLTLLIPLLNILFMIWIVIEVWFLKGTDGANRFGPDPLQCRTQLLQADNQHIVACPECKEEIELDEDE